MRFVLSLGGSVLGLSDFSTVAKRISGFGEVLGELAEKHKFFVVVGGGRIAREYIGIARELGADETFCDMIGISVTRINAMLLSSAVKKAPRRVPKDFVEAIELSRIYDVVIMGGTFPGHTTDATAALLAEFVGADYLLNATSVDGVYTEDPAKSKDARKIPEMSAKTLVEIVSREAAVAGANVVVDLLAAKIIERSGIKTVVFKGTPDNLRKIVRDLELGGGLSMGTLIH